jgi:hypothetical protein
MGLGCLFWRGRDQQTNVAYRGTRIRQLLESCFPSSFPIVLLRIGKQDVFPTIVVSAIECLTKVRIVCNLLATKIATQGFTA